MQDPIASLSQQRSTPQVATILSLLRKRKWLILGITLCAALATGLIVSKQPRVYEATASIVIELSVPQYLGSGFRDVVEVEPSWWHSRETLETEFRALRSHSQSLSVARALCDRQMGGAPALRFLVPNATCKDPAEYAKAAPVLRSMLRVTPVKDTRIVELTARSNHAEFAALVANTVAKVYEDRSLERRLSHSADAATWLGDEYAQLMSDLGAAETALIEFKTKNNVVAVSLEDDQSELAIRRRKLSLELSDVEVKLIGLRLEREQIKAAGTNDPIENADPALAKSTVAQKLRDLYIEEYGKLIGLQGKYLEKHPAIEAQSKRVDQVKQDLSREMVVSRKSFESQFELLSKQAEHLRSALGAATRESIKLEANMADLQRLQRNLERLVKLSEQVGGREQETTLASNLKTNNVRLLDRALVPSAPVAPNVPRTVMAAAAIALVLSMGLALLLDALDNTVKTQEDLEQAAGLTFLGLIPTIEAEDKASRNGRHNGEVGDLVVGEERSLADTFVFTHPKSQVAECCRAIRTNLLFMSPDNPARTLLVTSAGPQEGKTTVAANLGITMAASGLRVLLVDTDLRRPRLHKAFGISNLEGLSSAILSKGPVQQFIRPTEVPNLSVLPCGPCPPNPAELLHAERFRSIMRELASQFDRVVFDSPPLGAVTDAAILARITDATIMVAKAGRTSKYALARARRQVAPHPGVNLLGCVLNDVSLSRQREYGYYSYYYSRYGYYGKEEETGQAS
jgi:succinoglycan biosynthesis transport protein ExoP